MLLTPLNQSNHQVNRKKDRTLPPYLLSRFCSLNALCWVFMAAKLTTTESCGPSFRSHGSQLPSQRPQGNSLPVRALAARRSSSAGRQPPAAVKPRRAKPSRAKPKRAAGRAQLSSPEMLEQGRGGETRRAPLPLQFPTRLGVYSSQG